jgi:hypothetical protein
MPTFLHELANGTVFEGEVLDVEEDGDVYYEVHNGGWNWMGPDAPDTWLSEHVLARFKGQAVRITVESIGDAPGPDKEAWYALWGKQDTAKT